MALTQNNNKDLAQEIMEANKFIKKNCEHASSSEPFNSLNLR